MFLCKWEASRKNFRTTSRSLNAWDKTKLKIHSWFEFLLSNLNNNSVLEESNEKFEPLKCRVNEVRRWKIRVRYWGWLRKDAGLLWKSKSKEKFHPKKISYSVLLYIAHLFPIRYWTVKLITGGHWLPAAVANLIFIVKIIQVQVKQVSASVWGNAMRCKVLL